MTDNPDPFALARSEADAELIALIAEYWRWEAAINKAAGDDDETEVDRLCDQSRAVRDHINEIRPTTLRGVLAALDFGSEMEDPHYWPEGATEGLREIVEREAGPCEIELSELRARAEALAAEYDAPLPEGDVGLIEAERRMHALDTRREALGEPNTPEIEEIINLAFLAMCRLDERIATRPATTLAGAAVKLRRLLHPELGMDTGGKETDGPCLHHVLSVIEREAQP